MKASRNNAIALMLWLLAMPLPAHAYIGPGAGLSALGSLVALVGGFFLLLAGFVWYPIKRTLRSRAARRANDAKSAATRSGAATSEE